MLPLGLPIASCPRTLNQNSRYVLTLLATIDASLGSISRVTAVGGGARAGLAGHQAGSATGRGRAVSFGPLFTGGRR